MSSTSTTNITTHLGREDGLGAGPLEGGGLEPQRLVQLLPVFERLAVLGDPPDPCLPLDGVDLLPLRPLGEAVGEDAVVDLRVRPPRPDALVDELQERLPDVVGVTPTGCACWLRWESGFDWVGKVDLVGLGKWMGCRRSFGQPHGSES